MTTTTLTKAVKTLIATGSSNAAGTGNFTRGTADMRTAMGGMLTIKLTNTGTLGDQAEARILISHNTGTTPAAASAGADWKTVYKVGNGLVSGVVGEWTYNVPAGVMHIEVEVNGNTTNAVSCEAYLSEMSNSVSA